MLKHAWHTNKFYSTMKDIYSIHIYGCETFFFNAQISNMRVFFIVAVLFLYAFSVRPIIGPWTSRIVNAPKPTPSAPMQTRTIPLPGNKC
jgi:hypothetical protein